MVAYPMRNESERRSGRRAEWLRAEFGTGGIRLHVLPRTLACGLRPRTRESAAPSQPNGGICKA